MEIERNLMINEKEANDIYKLWTEIQHLQSKKEF